MCGTDADRASAPVLLASETVGRSWNSALRCKCYALECRRHRLSVVAPRVLAAQEIHTTPRFLIRSSSCRHLNRFSRPTGRNQEESESVVDAPCAPELEGAH